MRISEAIRVSLFVPAINFIKNKVFTRCILLGSTGDIFAANIMHHKNCLSNYLRKFEREVEVIMNPPLDSAENVEITNTFQELLMTININHAYCLSDCRDSFNEVLNRQGMNVNYFFMDPVGTGVSLGHPIQWIIWRGDVTKYVPGRSKTKQISSPKRIDVPHKLILKYS